MQEDDWGKYSQAPWKTAGASKNTTTSTDSKKTKAKQPTRASHTNKHADNNSKEKPSQDGDKFKTEIDLADLRIQLRRWNFARSWNSASSGSLADESHISPWNRPEDVDDRAICPGKRVLLAGQERETQVKTMAKTNPRLERYLIGPYLDKCIAATESQLAMGRHKSKKTKAVKEIERLVETVVTQADLARERKN